MALPPINVAAPAAGFRGRPLLIGAAVVGGVGLATAAVVGFINANQPKTDAPGTTPTTGPLPQTTPDPQPTPDPATSGSAGPVAPTAPDTTVHTLPATRRYTLPVEGPRTSANSHANIVAPNYGYDTSYEGIYNALYYAAPQSWGVNDVATVASAASYAGKNSSDAIQMVRGVYNSTPYDWSSTQEAQIAAEALTVGRSAYDTGRVIDQVEYATPYNWSNASDVRLAIAALDGHVPSSNVDDVIRASVSTGYYSYESQDVARAEASLLAGGYSYPSYPSYPTYPSYPSFPDYGSGSNPDTGPIPGGNDNYPTGGDTGPIPGGNDSYPPTGDTGSIPGDGGDNYLAPRPGVETAV